MNPFFILLWHFFMKFGAFVYLEFSKRFARIFVNKRERNSKFARQPKDRNVSSADLCNGKVGNVCVRKGVKLFKLGSHQQHNCRGSLKQQCEEFHYSSVIMHQSQQCNDKSTCREREFSKLMLTSHCRLRRIFWGDSAGVKLLFFKCFTWYFFHWLGSKIRKAIESQISAKGLPFKIGFWIQLPTTVPINFNMNQFTVVT